MRRVGIFGWGIVAPRSPNIDSFARNLTSSESWLTPFNGFGPDNFLVGQPAFDLERYRPWFDERFKPNRFSQVETKLGQPVQYAIGSFIQALEQNPGIEKELTRLGTRAHVLIGTGLGDLQTSYEQSLRFYHAQRRWNRFWAAPENNRVLKTWREDPSSLDADIPADPDTVPNGEGHLEAEDAWWTFWSERSEELRAYLDELREIESIGVEGDVESGKLVALKEKSRRRRKLQQSCGCPEPPWTAVSPNLLWNIANISAAQISMLGNITGSAIAPVAACSTFGVSLRYAIDAIRADQADAVVVGATDPAPHPLTVSAFYNARVLAADGVPSLPLTGLRGTHIAGGSVVWIVGALDAMQARGFRPLGLEPLAVGVTSDADHIITPSKEGPTEAMRQAFAAAGTQPDDIVSWDMHATATPGDYNEVEMVRAMMPDDVLVTARKGTFGHGMAAGGGWELTAQYLGHARGEIFPTPLSRDHLNSEIEGVHQRFAFDTACPAPDGTIGKMSMGVGGINACVISRPWPAQVLEATVEKAKKSA
ncbi:MAG: beta-ketoacyl synthase N-terminal-like domain-containing protein [Acidobacteriota bacterium]